MKRGISILALVMSLALTEHGFSAPFKIYPGAKLDDVYGTKSSGPAGKISNSPKVVVFTTNDLFENVVAFYRGVAKEYKVPGMGRNAVRLPSGQELKEAYFILDEAADLSTSKHWIKIQRPYLGMDPSGGLSYSKNSKVRDVTAIIEEDKRSFR